MLSDDKLISRFERDLKLAKTGLAKQWENTKKCIDFYSGDLMDYEDQIQYTVRGGKKKRALIKFNKVMPYVDVVAGFMQQNRREVKYVARNVGSELQEEYSRRANATSGYVRDNVGAEHLESEQDLDMLVNGYGAVETEVSYIAGRSSLTPNGDIVMARLDPQTTFWDARAKRKNLEDSRYVGYWQDYSIDDALSLFTGSKEDDFEQADAQDTERYYYNPYGGRYDKTTMDYSVEWSDKKEKLIRVYNYQWWEFEAYYQADNPIYTFSTPEAANLAAMQLDQIAAENPSEDAFRFDPRAKRLTFNAKIKGELVKIFGKFIQPVEFKRRKYYTAVISGKKIFTKFESICQNDFSIQFKTGTYDASRKIFIGMVNNMMEPQLYYNKALTEMMFTISANSKGGAIVERSAVKDVQNFEDKYASTTGVIVVEDGAISGGKIMPKGQNIPTTGLDGILVLTDQSIADASGIDKSFLGSKESAQETGILFKRRIRQVISTMAKYFDSVTKYQKSQARLMLDFMRIWSENNEGAMIELLGVNGEYESMELNSSIMMAEYGVVLNEAMQTQEDKQETAEMLSTIGDKLVAAGSMDKGQAIYMTAIKYLPIDGADRQQLAKIMEQQAPQIDPAEYQALQQQVQLLSSETNKADVEKKLSDARLNDARAQEIMMGKQGDNTLKGAELELKREQMQIDARNAENEAAIKASELEIEAQRLLLEAERIKNEAAQARFDADVRMAEINSTNEVEKIRITAPPSEPKEDGDMVEPKEDKSAIAMMAMAAAMEKLAQPRDVKISRDSNGQMSKIIQQ